MAVYYATESEDDDLEHHGIKGQKWGVRRFQNPSENVSKERFGEMYKEAKSLEVSKKEAAFISDSEKAKGEEIYQKALDAYADSLIAKEKEEKKKEEREKALAKAS